ncbi:MAG: hypothetical protein QOI86_2435, partial [Actinomycetota bacterium]|nr:hypothetical protein [Actinomycetota bacterium]
ALAADRLRRARLMAAGAAGAVARRAPANRRS